MRSVLFIIAFIISTGVSSCKKDCEPTNATCNETPPTNEMCQAAFNRWFFDKSTNTCSQKFYSGCSQKGFATKQDCEQCKCQ